MWKTIEKICRFCLNVIWKHLLKKELSDDMFLAFMQFVKFGIVGVSNTAVGYLINIGTLFLLRPYELSWDYLVGNTVSFFLSVLWAFYWSNKYVFTVEKGEKRSIWKTLLKTYISYAFTGIVLNNILSAIWINGLGISKYIAPLINLVISVPINFLLNKLWAYKTES